MVALRREKAEIQAKSEEMANLYELKSEHCQQLASNYDYLKKRLQDADGRGAAAICPGHDMHVMGGTSRPETFAGTSHGRAALRRDDGELKQYIPTDRNGVEQLHPFQRSGSALRGRGSSSDLVAQLMPPPPPPLRTRRHARSESLRSLEENLTPAHRSAATLDRSSTQRGMSLFQHGSSGKHQTEHSGLGLGVGLRGRMRSSGPFHGE